MSWGETIKINSDMTVSLDKLIKSAKSELVDLINSQRSLGASDSVIKVILSESTSIGASGQIEIGTFTCNKDGSVRIKWDMRSNGNVNGHITSSFSVKDSLGNTIFSESLASGQGTDTGWVNYSKDMSVTAGIAYVIMGETSSGSGTGYFNNVNVCASVIDKSFIN